jgi:UDP-GlcNAc3NAcA epimerase
MKILSVIGARPQFVKMAALYRAIQEKNGLQSVIVHTGQHYDPNMSDIFFKELELPEPDYNLNINQLSRAEAISQMTAAIIQILRNEEPDVVVVFGDTNSTLAGALASHQANIPLAHIEAGLRSYDTSMPEEVNRVKTDQLSDMLFCPTQQAIENLKKEGIANKVYLSGDIMLDAINYHSQKIKDSKRHTSNIPSHEFILCTLHREHLIESKEELANVVTALNKINKNTPILMPAHPRTKKAIEKCLTSPEFQIIEPVGYREMLTLLNNCKLVITDSGGLQKEAYWCKKMCITIRNETEWKELVDAGVNILAGTDSEKIWNAYNTAQNIKGDFSKSFYGDGTAANKIVDIISADHLTRT